MAVSNPTGPVEATFIIGNNRYSISRTRGQIVHEAFPAALPEELTVGHRLTFRTLSGDEVFADNFLGEIADAEFAVGLQM